MTDLLIAYWQGEGPEDRSARNVCRLLADQVLSRLPANVAQSVPGDASMYAAEIIMAVTELVRSDPEARALAESLSPTGQAATAQRVSVSGGHNLVIIAGRDIRGLDVQVSSESREEIVTRATGETSKEQDKHLAQLRQLRQLLATHFDEGELRTLCFDLGIDYDDLPGEGKANKARELVAYLDRHGRIPELLRAGEQLRPDISWNDTH